MNEEKEDKFKKELLILEAKLEKEKDHWDNELKKLTSALKGDIKKLIDVQAEVINNQQTVTSEIRKLALSLHKYNVNIKELKKNRFEYYNGGGYQMNLKNSTDKMRMVEFSLGKYEYKVDLLNTHISYLNDTASNLGNLNYAVKNRIELLEILGLD